MQNKEIEDIGKDIAQLKQYQEQLEEMRARYEEMDKPEAVSVTYSIDEISSAITDTLYSILSYQYKI